MMKLSPNRTSVVCVTLLLLVSVAVSDQPKNSQRQGGDKPSGRKDKPAKVTTMKVQYLEIVTPDVNETCKALAEAHSVKFSDPVAELGNARTADLKDGGRIGVRAPMRETEKPIVRPYILVDNIEAAVKAAEAAGAQLAMPPMKLPGQGTFAIYILGGIEHGLWQL